MEHTVFIIYHGANNFIVGFYLKKFSTVQLYFWKEKGVTGLLGHHHSILFLLCGCMHLTQSPTRSLPIINSLSEERAMRGERQREREMERGGGRGRGRVNGWEGKEDDESERKKARWRGEKRGHCFERREIACLAAALSPLTCLLAALGP